jgi:cation diffusion facilitator CzcD-associated flavoprotein CzcO
MTQYEAIVIGAGVAGIYQIKRLADLGIEATVLEAGGDLGGTWYWNRYPGARFDSESYTYGYTFSRELLDEWHWKEHFSGQPENLRYLNHVADRFGLRRYMQFNCRVEAAHYDEAESLWHVRVSDGRELTCRFLILTLGLLSMPTLPRVEGMDSFKGRSFHTFHWPQEPVDMTGKRVAVIGTGATGIQVIGEIADKVGDLTVFQRRPNWSAPLNNAPIPEAEMADIRRRYDEIFAACARSPGGFVHEPDRRGFYEVTAEERKALWDRLYDEPGFGIWLGNFREIFTDEKANAEFSEYIANRIRQRVRDPKVAEKLIPRDHGFGVQRVPMETRYFEAYNRPNVHLVDISETPLVRVTETGLRTTERDYDFDIIVYATGFDAITGAFDRIDFVGPTGQHLRDKWRDGPSTYLGVQTAGFPNLIMIAGPQGASVSTNFPRAIEYAVDWATALIEHMAERGLDRVEAAPDAEAEWTEHVKELYGMLLLRNAKSWFTGYNSNVEGHDIKRYLIYNGGAPRYRKYLDEIAAEGYRGFRFA